MDLPDCDFNSTGIFDLYLIYELSDNISQCGKDTLPFFCNTTLLLCNGNSSSVDLTEECEDIRDNKCASEWRIMESFYNLTFPSCMSFTNSGNLTFERAPFLSCPNQFDHHCGSTCSPVCGEYSFLARDTSSYYLRFVIAVCGVIGLIGGIVTLVASYYNRHKVYVICCLASTLCAQSGIVCYLHTKLICKV